VILSDQPQMFRIVFKELLQAKAAMLVIKIKIYTVPPAPPKVIVVNRAR
jgi:hypothetical protein